MSDAGDTLKSSSSRLLPCPRPPFTAEQRARLWEEYRHKREEQRRASRQALLLREQAAQTATAQAAEPSAKHASQVRETRKKRWTAYVKACKEEKTVPTLNLSGLLLSSETIDYFAEQRSKLILEEASNSDGSRTFDKPQVEKIVMLGCCSFVDDDAVERLIQFMKAKGNELKDSVLGHPGAQLMTPLLGRMPRLLHLQRLSLVSIDFVEQNLENLLGNPKCNITELSLSTCTFYGDMYHRFLHGLKEHGQGFRSLEMGLNLNDQTLFHLVRALVNSATKDTLETLDLSCNKLGSDSLSELAILLDQFTRLNELDLCICQGLFQDLQPNDLRYKCFANALERNRHLLFLNLSGSRVTSDQAASLFQALESNCTLQRLDVWSIHDLTDPIQKYLPKMRGLRRLRVRLDLKDSGLQRSLRQNSSLVYMDSVKGQFEVDTDVSKLFSRNKMIQIVSSNYLNKRWEKLDARIWSLCLEQLMCRCRKEDMSPVYKFILGTSLSIATQGMKKSGMNKKRGCPHEPL